ncbi:DUF4153 domain-containing protein [Erythrobacter sp. EC-HK427]|uniref:DUF4153 domain-containing protein n=1 Tax=Erythrobacter sp. EC-HK427 TaxID=2038396 RepID=UPI001256E849|nr:DUF4153 domain-containing protein [Erythrobacter sp. EC-HK427]VVS98112.1 conserved membrane hypothetical protein [Erythrobacter sp. EC-HK427]
MDETADAVTRVEGEDWALRPWLLAAIGGVAGLLLYHLLDGWDNDAPQAWRPALSAFCFFAAAAAGFVLRPVRLAESLVFALGLGAVMGGIAWLAANAAESRAATDFAFAAGVFFSLLAIPLFQAGFHRTRWATPYLLTHFHVWTDAVSAGGAVLFMGLSWLLLWLLHGLFSLIGITVIEELIQEGWFPAIFIGATLGAALGVLRNQQSIIGTLQRVVMLVFALLAVPFAGAILIFVVILLASGGSALWEATDSATPVLLACAVICFILTNAVVRDDDESRSANIVMQAAALVLALCILPLTVFAAISMGIRIDQYGLAPERIWALIAIAISTAYGLAYWVGVARGRLAGWSANLRRANLHLAVVTCGIALFLALPFLDFGAISTRDQVARLESGAVAPSAFDYTALRWDFGDAGRAALAELTESEDATIAQYASEAQAQTERPWYGERPQQELAGIAENVDLAAFDEATASAIRAYIREEGYLCEASEGTDPCRVELLAEAPQGKLLALIPADDYASNPRLLLVRPGAVRAVEQYSRNGVLADNTATEVHSSTDAEGVELRPYQGQQLFIDGQPVGDPFRFEARPETTEPTE